MITSQQVEAASDELDYVSYVEARKAGESQDAIAGYFGIRRVSLEARYQREHNAGARIADECFCPGGCGKRGYRFVCRECSQ